MDTWNRLTDLRGEGVGDTRKDLLKNIYVLYLINGHRQHCGKSTGGVR